MHQLEVIDPQRLTKAFVEHSKGVEVDVFPCLVAPAITMLLHVLTEMIAIDVKTNAFVILTYDRDTIDVHREHCWSGK